MGSPAPDLNQCSVRVGFLMAGLGSKRFDSPRRSRSRQLRWRATSAFFPALIVLGTSGLPVWSAPSPQETLPEQTSRRLLAALSEQGYHDTALTLLDRLADDHNLTVAFREAIPLRRAAEQIALVRFDPDLEKRQRVYAEARREIDQLLSGQPESSLAAEAALQRGVLLLEQGRLARLTTVSQPANEAAMLFSRAVTVLVGPDSAVTAQAAFRREQEAVERELAGYRGRRIVRREERLVRDRLENQREQLRGRAVQVLLLAAEASAERARCFQTGSDDWETALKHAIKRFHELAQQQHARAAGLWAQVEEGRACLEIGESERGLALLADVLDLPATEPLIERLQTRAVAASLEAWLATATTADDARFGERLRQQVLRLGPRNSLDADALAAKVRAAELLQRRAKGTEAGDRRQRARLFEDARKLATDVARVNRDYAVEARSLLASLDQRGADAAERYGQSLAATVERAEAIVTQLRAMPSKALRNEAIVALRLARAAAWQELPEDGKNWQRQQLQLSYQLATLLYEEGRYHEAAVLGEHLLVTAPNEPVSRQAATVALASWQALQQQPTASWAGQAIRQITRLADAIMRQWPTETESTAAAMLAIDLAARAHDLEAIEGLLSGLDEHAVKRAAIVLRGGVTLWQHSQQQSAAVVSHWEKRATAWLDKGLSLIGDTESLEQEVLSVAVTAAVARCSLLLDSHVVEAEHLKRLLMHPVWGAWPQLRSLSPALPQQIVEAGLTICLRSFVILGNDAMAARALERLVEYGKDNREAAMRLAGTTATIGRRLLKNLEESAGQSQRQGHDNELVAARLELLRQFLEVAQDSPGPRAVVVWAAVTLRQLGSSTGPLHRIIPRESRQIFLEQAVQVTMRLLPDAADQQQTALRLQLAVVLAELQKWEESLVQISQVLVDEEGARSVMVQRQAAELLEAAGHQTTDAVLARQRFQEAAVGRKRSLPEGTAVFWGWGGLASRLSNRAFGSDDEAAHRLRKIYFEARLHLAGCRLAWAGREATSDARRKRLQQAAADIKIEARLHPELGGDELRPKFEMLMGEIEKELSKLTGK